MVNFSGKMPLQFLEFKLDNLNLEMDGTLKLDIQFS